MNLFTKEMIAPCGLDCSVCIARLEKTHHVRAVGARKRASPNIVPNSARLLSVNVSKVWKTAIVTNAKIIHAHIFLEWRINISKIIH